jgi:hypothetical protein
MTCPLVSHRGERCHDLFAAPSELVVRPIAALFSQPTMLAHNLSQVERVMHPLHPAVSVVRIPVEPAHLLSPVVEQLGIFTEDSLGNGGIKIIHVPQSYEQAATVINK